MSEILGKAKTVRDLLQGVKYSIDYYQREYKWQTKQIRELIDDLSTKFLGAYQPSHDRHEVGKYPQYFLGSIIISKKDGTSFIVDGQQRLTSLTLLLILLRNLQGNRPNQVKVDDLIFSEQYGKKSFNIRVDDRTLVMDALYGGQLPDTTEKSESVQNLVLRYNDLQEFFPPELLDEALPYFIDWLIDKVCLIEITAYSDDDAYTIFETMNDRGLSLTPTDMLKGYLLANMSEQNRTTANALWRNRTLEMAEVGKEVDSEFFKAWFRSQYATKIRERKQGGKPENFDRIGTEFHRWLRETAVELNLQRQTDFYRFVEIDFIFYSQQFLRIINASTKPVAGLEAIYYNAQQGFTLQPMLLLAPLRPKDDPATIDQKLSLVARYVDILLTWRIWNSRSISYSTLQYAMFLVMRDIRGLDVTPLAEKLHASLRQETDTFSTTNIPILNKQNRRILHRFLARLMNYIEVNSGQASHYAEFVAEGRNRYEVEHIWADVHDTYVTGVRDESEFKELRNHIGGLLLLPKKFNASFGAMNYTEKLNHYHSQNLLARSLHPNCYKHNPGFNQFIIKSGLPFSAHNQFKRADLNKRTNLYRKLAQQIWNPDDLLAPGGAR